MKDYQRQEITCNTRRMNKQQVTDSGKNDNIKTLHTNKQQ